MIKYFSMFSGVGGFDEGIHRALGDDAQCVGISEIDKYAISIYNKHFKGVTNYGDARKINTKELPDFDLLVGGFPCQSFSQAGLRQGFLDTRGTLFYEIARVCQDKRPRYLLLENVKGLLSLDDGKAFATILRVFSDLGYVLQWEVCNSCDFGVPQNRERVFIVGHLGRESFREVFPLREGRTITKEADGARSDIRVQSSSASPREYGWSDKAGTLQARDYKDPKFIKIDKPTSLTEARTEAAKELRRRMRFQEDIDYSPRRGKKVVPRKDDLANTVTATPTVENLIIDKDKKNDK